MVLALLQRVPYAHDPYWADGLRRFGVSYLVGVNDKIKLNADDFPYETCPHHILNDNERS